jgi:hypothetical protein
LACVDERPARADPDVPEALLDRREVEAGVKIRAILEAAVEVFQEQARAGLRLKDAMAGEVEDGGPARSPTAVLDERVERVLGVRGVGSASAAEARRPSRAASASVGDRSTRRLRSGDCAGGRYSSLSHSANPSADEAAESSSFIFHADSRAMRDRS